jgi:pimeloyl-ACP methyl ester carboxylesterase
MWAQLRTDPAVPLPVRILLKCLRHTTSTYARGRFSPRVRSSRLIVYNHGLVSFASENTSLRRTAALKEAKGPERARLAVEYYAASPNTNRIVVERSADTSFVLEHVGAVLEQIPGRDLGSIDTSSAHLVGFSVGGAVATEAARSDPRVASVTNLDGGMYGTLGRAEIGQPYLMMYSAANDGMNDALLPSGARRFVGEGTGHLNYHDVAGLVPGLRLLGAIGRTDPRSFLRQRNQIVREFCAAQGA